MVRGTTPTLIFKLPFAASEMTKLHIAISQGNAIKIEKHLADCQTDGQTITLRLSEADTLRLESGGTTAAIQLRCRVGGSTLASRIITTSVNKILKEGLLDDITG